MMPTPHAQQLTEMPPALQGNFKQVSSLFCTKMRGTLLPGPCNAARGTKDGNEERRQKSAPHAQQLYKGCLCTAGQPGQY